MAIHTVAFVESIGSATLTAIQPAADGVFRVLDKGIIPEVDGVLIAAVAGGTLLSQAQVVAPSMDITPANVHPLNTFPWPSTTGAMFNHSSAPRLLGQEAFIVRVRNAGAANTAVVVWVCSQIDPVPPGESFLLEFTATPTLVSVTWVATKLTFTVPFLPAGRYHILGMEAHATNGEDDHVAARLLIAGQKLRPGTIVTTNPRQLPPPFLMDGSMGDWGSFDQKTPPKIEVIGFASGAMEVGGYLRVVREQSEKMESGTTSMNGWT